MLYELSAQDKICIIFFISLLNKTRKLKKQTSVKEYNEYTFYLLCFLLSLNVLTKNNCVKNSCTT